MKGALALALLLAVWFASAGAASADEWDVRVPDEITVAPGDAAAVSLTLAPGGGRTISTDAPIRISLDSETLTLPRKRYGRKQAADPGAEAPRFDLRLVAPTAGDHELTVEVRAWVCARKTCRPMRTSRTVIIRAAPPTPVQPSSP